MVECDEPALSHACCRANALRVAFMLAQKTPCVVALLLVPLLRAQQGPVPSLRDLDEPDVPYRTPRSGEGVRASLFETTIEIAPRDRRSVAAWQLGVAAAVDADDNEAVPFGSLYVWEHPDDGHLLRASLSGVYDQVTWASTDGNCHELMLTFENFTLPWASGELVDGLVDDGEKLHWGYVRAGIGPGWRRRTAPFGQENMLASDVLFEPGLLYFGRDDRTDPGYQVPDSTPELRLRWVLRYDGIERNLLELPHAGVAIGADAVFGYRVRSEDWGRAGADFHRGDHDYTQATAYAFFITGVPGLSTASLERHRLYASLHGGLGDGLDRFSAQRVGGGPDLRGAEYETTARPWLPGAAYSEYFPDHYMIGSLGYRRELGFFAHLDVGGTVAWLDRDRMRSAGREREDETLVAFSVRLSSGFIGRTLLQLGYGHNFDVVRDGERGGDEFTLMVTGRF